MRKKSCFFMIYRDNSSTGLYLEILTEMDSDQGSDDETDICTLANDLYKK
jgi:hypothetical protein